MLSCGHAGPSADSVDVSSQFTVGAWEVTTGAKDIVSDTPAGLGDIDPTSLLDAASDATSLADGVSSTDAKAFMDTGDAADSSVLIACPIEASATCPYAPVGSPGVPPSDPVPFCQDPWPEEWVAAGMEATSTLQLEIGRIDETTKIFTPFVDGGWLPIIHGPQTLAMVEFDVRFSGTSVVATSQLHKIWQTGRFGCDLLNGPLMSALNIKPIDGTQDWVDSNGPRQMVFNLHTWDTWKLCGKWIDLRVAVWIGGGQWATVRRVMRFWDDAASICRWCGQGQSCPCCASKTYCQCST